MNFALGRTIQQARLRRSLTQEVLAGTAGVSVRRLSNVENGLVPAPSMDYLFERIGVYFSSGDSGDWSGCGEAP